MKKVKIITCTNSSVQLYTVQLYTVQCTCTMYILYNVCAMILTFVRLGVISFSSLRQKCQVKNKCKVPQFFGQSATNGTSTIVWEPLLYSTSLVYWIIWTHSFTFAGCKKLGVKHSPNRYASFSKARLSPQCVSRCGVLHDFLYWLIIQTQWWRVQLYYTLHSILCIYFNIYVCIIEDLFEYRASTAWNDFGSFPRIRLKFYCSQTC